MTSKCYLCSDPTKSENPILKCQKCDLVAHAMCYGITDVDNFVCSPCINGVSLDLIECGICHRGQNALKKTTNEGWVHVVCALFTNGAEFVDKTAMEPIDITKVVQSKKKLMCVYCDGKFGTLKCCTKKCKKYFHASCALENDCVEELLDEAENILFHGYCPEHKPNKKFKRLSSDNITIAVNVKVNKQQVNAAAKKNADWINKKVMGMYFVQFGV